MAIEVWVERLDELEVEEQRRRKRGTMKEGHDLEDLDESNEINDLPKESEDNEGAQKKMDGKRCLTIHPLFLAHTGRCVVWWGWIF